MKVLSCNVGAIHELPLHSVTKTFSTIGAFQKTKLLQENIPCWDVHWEQRRLLRSWGERQVEY